MGGEGWGSGQHQTDRVVGRFDVFWRHSRAVARMNGGIEGRGGGGGVRFIALPQFPVFFLIILVSWKVLVTYAFYFCLPPFRFLDLRIDLPNDVLGATRLKILLFLTVQTHACLLTPRIAPASSAVLMCY